ncbi:MAG: carnitine 3-dehydrogenase, partial [Paracoccaceae bacterium]
MTQTAAIIGGGVIGGGWAARFLLMGWDVRIFDPDPEAERKIGAVLDNARAAMPGLFDVPMRAEGTLSFHDAIPGAVAGAAWIQESVPERLEIKHAVYRTIQEHCDAGAIIGSSTSGFTPSALQQGAVRPGQIVVTHPFNPVYLLPLVELVASPENPSELVTRAKDMLTGLGMYPLHVRKEIDAHIADRLLESVWREALWLVRDGVATTAEIDEAIRMGFGLRWAQMGLFETYRIAGGESGMAHFMEQFGPCLDLPWTRLTDVPEMTDDLVARIAAQSDAQSGARTIAELEKIRDTNLVAFLRALKWAGWGAGVHLREVDGAMRDDEIDITRPIVTTAHSVPLDWTDYNGHMTEPRYGQAFSDATDRFMEIVGCDAEYIASGGSFFTAETHIRFLQEIHAGAPFRVETLCLDGAGKKMHLFHTMYSGDKALATGETLLIHVSMQSRRPAPPAPHVAERLHAIAAA